MNNLKLFDESILKPYFKKERPNKIAIVGNSGVSESDNDFINDADVVIRFNNYATRQSIVQTKDKFKCDILFSTFDLHSVGSKPKDVVIGIPFPFKAKEIITKPDRWYPASNHWMINPYKNMEMCAELRIDSLGCEHPLPSVGFTALWHMRNWKCDFYVCGFEWYFDGRSKFQNWDLKNKEYPNHWNHNYPKEIEWVIKKLLKKNNFIFSDRCSYILKVAQHLLQ